jgi:hypothetical protein
MARIRGLVALLIVVTLGVIGWRIARDTPPGGAVPQTVPSQDAPQSTDAVADAARADLPKPVEHPAQPLPSDAVERDTARSDGLGSVGGAVRVTARIVDRDGAPLPDARAVWLPNTATLVAAGLSPGTWGTWMPSMQPPTPLDRLPQARGDAEGRVALDVRLVPADGEDEWWDDDPTMALPALLVMHPGRSTRIASAGKLEDGVGDLGEIVLLPEAVVTGRVVDEDGRPLAGLRIRLLS